MFLLSFGPFLGKASVFVTKLCVYSKERKMHYICFSVFPFCSAFLLYSLMLSTIIFSLFSAGVLFHFILQFYRLIVKMNFIIHSNNDKGVRYL